jgi:ribokinase
MLVSKLKKVGISTEYITASLSATPQTIVLFSSETTRQVINDVKESRQTKYDEALFDKALADSDYLVLCNSHYVKPFIQKAKASGKMIASDVHAIREIGEKRNREFMENADILCFSNSHIKEPYEAFIKEVEKRYGTEIIIMGMGSKGSMMYVKKDDFIGSFPTVRTREVVNTLGAGDSQLSAFVHFYSKTGNPYYSLKVAILFASYKIGNPSAAHGFLDEETVEMLYDKIWK